MREITGDFWDVVKEFSSKGYDDAIVCPTNCIIKENDRLVMGAGLAKDFNKRFPDLSRHAGNLAKEWFNKHNVKSLPVFLYPDCYCSENYITGNQDIILLPTKINWKNDSLKGLIQDGIKQLVVLANSIGWTNIIMTRPGCGLGGLGWKNTTNDTQPVKYLLELTEGFDDRFVIVNKE